MINAILQRNTANRLIELGKHSVLYRISNVPKYDFVIDITIDLLLLLVASTSIMDNVSTICTTIKRQRNVEHHLSPEDINLNKSSVQNEFIRSVR